MPIYFGPLTTGSFFQFWNMYSNVICFHSKDDLIQHCVKDMDIKLCYVIENLCCVFTIGLANPLMKSCHGWLRPTGNYGMRFYAIINWIIVVKRASRSIYNQFCVLGWGTICDDSWDNRDATVACRMLGYDRGTSVGNAHFGAGTGPIFMDDVRCTGQERSLWDCPRNGWEVENCGHGEDAGVRCCECASV